MSIHLYLAGPAATGAISAATLTAARTAFETIGAWSTGPRQTLDGTRALQMAMRRICTAYTTVSQGDLDLLRQQELPGGTGWALDIAAPGPTLFRIEITAATGIPVTTRITSGNTTRRNFSTPPRTPTATRGWPQARAANPPGPERPHSDLRNPDPDKGTDRGLVPHART